MNRSDAKVVVVCAGTLLAVWFAYGGRSVMSTVAHSGSDALLRGFDAATQASSTPSGDQGYLLDSDNAARGDVGSIADEVEQMFNADLGADGLTITHEEIEQALSDDQQLQDAVLNEADTSEPYWEDLADVTAGEETSAGESGWEIES